ncbi:hypothetical protein CHS0354_007838 [Potamilus streckersoni]|uniref:Glucans biosynthesis glucosyltransferase H n=1 Tax=Potamilus streckersoni TaxID=2493646 RepID=A0AAE0SJI7_9BIVA|nr:hypothetical protein CHS0354_007838 [Potamilus streckersoni]
MSGLSTFLISLLDLPQIILNKKDFIQNMKTISAPGLLIYNKGRNNIRCQKVNMKKFHRITLYFLLWLHFAAFAIVLNVLNIDWSVTSLANGVAVIIFLGILQGSVLEIPVQSIATLIVGGHKRQNKKCSSEGLTVILNYNLLATSRGDIEECFQSMHCAFMRNLDQNVSAVLLSATNDAELKRYELDMRNKYRSLIYFELFHEGVLFSERDWEKIDVHRLQKIWLNFIHIEPLEFLYCHLDGICEKFIREFMVIHRVSRVLKKCGQYQDLMLLSDGHLTAFSYCDTDYYGKSAREYGEPLFEPSSDVNNIQNRKFDYTLVLDSDTGVPAGTVQKLLQIAAAHPNSGIIQPAIKLQCSESDTIFMQLETSRQNIYEPITNAMTSILEQSSFYGKGLIKNRIYIDNVIGSEEKLIERVPVDVISHDTFEAAILKPLYAGSVYLTEAPCHNYVTWNIRERRWNRGEILLAMYFWPNMFGRPMRLLQRLFQGKCYNKIQLRTKTSLDFVTSYIAHSALRNMFMKPLLFVYICIHYGVKMHYDYTPIIIIMFLVVVFPKFATCTRQNIKCVILETIGSICQFTPEAIVGIVRILRAWVANIGINLHWVPQRTVEEEFKKSNPLLSSFRHLWGYSLLAMVLGVLVVLFFQEAVLLLVMIATLFCLPFFTSATSLKVQLRCGDRRVHDHVASFQGTTAC